MSRIKKMIRAVVGDVMVEPSALVAKEPYGYCRIVARKQDELDRMVAVYFTNPGNARAVSKALAEWADRMDEQAVALGNEVSVAEIAGLADWAEN